jgi:peptidoglycan/xylan/chitin deacetylase (PgdA/CDA1 family)
MYIVSGCVQNQLPPWTYQLDNCLYHSRRLKIDIDASLLPEQLRKTQWDTVQQRVEYGRALKISMKQMSNEHRVAVLNQVLRELADVEVPRGLMLNWDEINQIITAGVEVGAHTHTHPLLASIADDASIKAELLQSYDLIQQHCRIAPYAISYPIGSYDQRVRDISREVGYQIGLAVNQKFYDDQRDDLFAIPRTELYNEHFIKARLRISGVYQKMKEILT